MVQVNRAVTPPPQKASGGVFGGLPVERWLGRMVRLTGGKTRGVHGNALLAVKLVGVHRGGERVEAERQAHLDVQAAAAAIAEARQQLLEAVDRETGE